jgi:predicted house-cleaning noncanonical NTP pyrophosphatase (MazG superfamily)
MMKHQITHAASEEEYGQRLLTKLEEEVREYQEGRELEELADILEVLYVIREYEGISEEQLERIRSEKAEERGRFERRIILEAVEV